MRCRTQVVEILQALSKPSIAMVHGFAVGAGLSIALACDLRYGDSSTKFKTGFLNAGLSGDYGVNYLLPRVVGPAKARELMLLSENILAESAFSIGLLNAFFPVNDLKSKVKSIAIKLAKGPQPATRLIKENISDGLTHSLSKVLDIECARHVKCSESEDHAEAISAFKEKRQPVFQRNID